MKAKTIAVIGIGIGLAYLLVMPYFATARVNVRPRKAHPNSPVMLEGKRLSELNRKANKAWHREKDHAKAEKLFKQAIALNPSRAFSSQRDLADLLFELHRDTDAWHAYKAFLRRTNWGSSDQALLFCRYAQLSEKRNDQKEAQWAYAQVIERCRRDRAGRGRLPDTMGPHPDLDSSDPRIMKATALLYAAGQTGVWDGREPSMPWLKRALATAPDQPFVHYALAKEYRSKQEKRKAWDHYMKALELEPNAQWGDRVRKEAEELAHTFARYAHDGKGNLVLVEQKVTPPR